MNNIEEKIYVFVYGTLLSNEINCHYLSNAKLVKRGIIEKGKFSLYDVFEKSVISFPCIKPDLYGSEIHGEIYEVSKIDLVFLDHLEGVGYNHYSREKIKIEGFDSEVYLYVYVGDVNNMKKITSGDWKIYNGLKKQDFINNTYKANNLNF